MGGVRRNVDKDTFVALVKDLESKNTYENMSRLQEAIAASDYGRGLDISAASAYQYIKKFEIKLKTGKGEKGAGLNKVNNAGTVRISRGDQWAKDPNAKKWIDGVRKSMHGFCSDIDATDGKPHVDRKKMKRLDKIVDKMAGGSAKACYAAMCIQCCAGDTTEVKNCEISDCALYQLRPWKQTDNEFADIELDDLPK